MNCREIKGNWPQSGTNIKTFEDIHDQNSPKFAFLIISLTRLNVASGIIPISDIIAENHFKVILKERVS
jgi:hypothetical protein